jgi:hypothetical protein
VKSEIEKFVKGQSKLTRPAYAVGIAAGAYLAYAGQGWPIQLIGGALLLVNFYGLWVSLKN